MDIQAFRDYIKHNYNNIVQTLIMIVGYNIFMVVYTNGFDWKTAGYNIFIQAGGYIFIQCRADFIKYSKGGNVDESSGN